MHQAAKAGERVSLFLLRATWEITRCSDSFSACSEEKVPVNVLRACRWIKIMMGNNHLATRTRRPLMITSERLSNCMEPQKTQRCVRGSLSLKEINICREADKLNRPPYGRKETRRLWLQNFSLLETGVQTHGRETRSVWLSLPATRKNNRESMNDVAF